MSKSPENSFDLVFEQAMDKRLLVYLTNGKAMEGILRSFDDISIRMDSIKGLKGGTAVKRDSISTATLV